MSWKDNFIKPSEEELKKRKLEKEKESQNQDKSKTQFPSNNQTVKTEDTNSVFSFNFGMGKSNPTPTPQNTGVSQEQINKALAIYEQGFKSLKQAGYDFQDLYEQLTDEDKGNPAAYQMAVRMASKFDKSVTKEKLMQSADFYIGKIIENYNNFVASGNAKKQEIVNQKTSESQALNNEMSMLQQQLIALQTQIQDRQNKINNIDNKYAGLLSDMDAKLAANDIAKNQMVNSLETVKQGVINNLK